MPAAVALADPKLEPVVATATVQVAASVVMSALLVPLIVSWWSKTVSYTHLDVYKRQG